MEAVVTLSPKVALHGRPGALIVHLSQQHPKAKIMLEKNGKTAEAKSILSLLALGVRRGEEVRVIVEGGDEKTILSEVKAILEGVKG